MKISIITATYNSAETIIDTVRSVETQTYDNIEYIIIDGASNDNTLELIERHCSRVSLIRSEPDLGIYDALNKGIALASGDFIGFLHSDDMLAYPEAISDMVDCIKKNNANAIYADLYYVEKNNKCKVVRRWISGLYNRKKLGWGWMPPHPTFYMCSNLYKELGGFDLAFRICADYDSILRYFMSDNFKVCYLHKVLVNMRTGGASNNSIINAVKKFKEERIILKKNGFFWPKVVTFKKLSKIFQFILA